MKLYPLRMALCQSKRFVKFITKMTISSHFEEQECPITSLAPSAPSLELHSEHPVGP
jgi:hypothetical protein